jgi:hypothetical protein
MSFEDDDMLPTLLPINHKKKLTAPTAIEPENKPKIDKKLSLDSPKRQEASAFKKERSSEREAKEAEELPPADVSGFDKRFKDMNEEGRKTEQEEKVKSTSKWKETQKSKELIAEILYKIQAKNVTEEKYPVSNETIEGVIKDADAEIAKLTA